MYARIRENLLQEVVKKCRKKEKVKNKRNISLLFAGVCLKQFECECSWNVFNNVPINFLIFILLPSSFSMLDRIQADVPSGAVQVCDGTQSQLMETALRLGEQRSKQQVLMDS